MIFELLLTLSSLAATESASNVKKAPVPKVLEDLRSRVSRANEDEYEGFLKNGLTPARAAARLKTIYTSKADHEYLDAYIKKSADARKPVRMKAFERTKAGYDITAPNGRVLHVSSRGPRQPVINGHTVPMNSLKAALAVYARAYGGQYARHHGIISLLAPNDAAADWAMDNQALVGLTIIILQTGTKWVAWGTVGTLIDELDRRTQLCTYDEGTSTQDDGNLNTYQNTDAGRYASILQDAGFADLKTGKIKEPMPTGSARDDARVQEVLKSVKKLMGCVSGYHPNPSPKPAPAAPNDSTNSSQ